MTNSPGEHVYLASGFFSDKQRDLCSFIELHEADKLKIFSPRNDGFTLKPDASQEEKAEIFGSNEYAIREASWMIAVIDDFDTGVIWEMGFAYAVGTRVMAYSDILGRGLNVMLANGCVLGFMSGRHGIGNLLNLISQGQDIENIAPMNPWGGRIE